MRQIVTLLCPAHLATPSWEVAAGKGGQGSRGHSGNSFHDDDADAARGRTDNSSLSRGNSNVLHNLRRQAAMAGNKGAVRGGEGKGQGQGPSWGFLVLCDCHSQC